MITVKKQLTINAPSNKVWSVLALQFENVGDWATGIAKSRINENAITPAGANVGGRICSVPGFGDLTEEFTNYDADKLTFSYEAVQGMPFFVKSARNTWTLTPKGNQTIVDMHLTAETNFFPGMLMSPFMKKQFNAQGQETIDDLKYFIENGQPSPSKRDALKKAS